MSAIGGETDIEWTPNVDSEFLAPTSPALNASENLLEGCRVTGEGVYHTGGLAVCERA